MDTSFERLAAPHQRRLHYTALSLCGDPDQASDLTQEALERAYRNFHRFRPGSPIFPWLARILRNIFLDTLKTGRARHEVCESRVGAATATPFLEGAPDPAPDPLDRVERAQLINWLRQEVARLPSEPRQVLTLCDVKGLSYVEAAEACGVPLGTVKSRLSRARATLQRRMRQRVAVTAPSPGMSWGFAAA